MARTRQDLGDRGELLAETFLTTRGYVVLARKYRCREGEIDLVCRDGAALAFVEVKLRRGTAFGSPEESVTPTKLARLTLACEHYLAAHAADLPAGTPDWRIDVVAIQLDTSGRMQEIRLIDHAGGW